MSIVGDEPRPRNRRKAVGSCFALLIASSLLLGACSSETSSTSTSASDSTDRVLGVSSGPLSVRWTNGPRAASFSGKANGVPFSGTSGQAPSTGSLPAFVAMGDFDGQPFKANLVARSDGSSPLDFYFQVTGMVGSLKIDGKATYTLNPTHGAATLHITGRVGDTPVSSVVAEAPGSGSKSSVTGTITVG